MALTEVKDIALHKTTFIFVRMLTKLNERSLIFCPIVLFQRNYHNRTIVKSIWDNSIIKIPIAKYPCNDYTCIFYCQKILDVIFS